MLLCVLSFDAFLLTELGHVVLLSWALLCSIDLCVFLCAAPCCTVLEWVGMRWAGAARCVRHEGERDKKEHWEVENKMWLDVQTNVVFGL